jgi:hypothetical protein
MGKGPIIPAIFRMGDAVEKIQFSHQITADAHWNIAYGLILGDEPVGQNEVAVLFMVKYIGLPTAA